ncbi:MAG: hypothetical protein K2F63_07200, partial [Muribaculaceae bacterium]|nr:hypothetical protein [Muribaculaceae bacterium]
MTAPARGIIALAMALMPFAGAFAKKPKAAEPDSLTRMVALFVAENTRRGIESMRTSFEAYGSTVDASAVRRLVAEQLDRPSDPVAYAEASKWISRFMDNRSEALSDHLLATAASEPDAEVLPSGVVIRIIQRGSGLCPEPTDIVSFRYTGT